jgi:hypothetical protein
LGTWTLVVPGVTEMLSPLWVGTVTPELPAVQLVPPTTVSGVAFWEIETIFTGKLLGFVIVRVRSALAPGWSLEEGVPVAAKTVTAVACLTVAVPVPKPLAVRKA